MGSTKDRDTIKRRVLTVSNISITSNTAIDFDLRIAGDAALGSRTVVVIYGYETKSIVGNNVLEVLERIN